MRRCQFNFSSEVVVLVLIAVEQHFGRIDDFLLRHIDRQFEYEGSRLSALECFLCKLFVDNLVVECEHDGVVSCGFDTHVRDGNLDGFCFSYDRILGYADGSGSQVFACSFRNVPVVHEDVVGGIWQIAYDADLRFLSGDLGQVEHVLYPSGISCECLLLGDGLEVTAIGCCLYGDVCAFGHIGCVVEPESEHGM